MRYFALYQYGLAVAARSPMNVRDCTAFFRHSPVAVGGGCLPTIEHKTLLQQAFVLSNAK